MKRYMVRKRIDQYLFNIQQAGLLLLCFCFFSQASQAQAKLPVFSWRTHFSYHHVVALAEGKEHLYAATSHAIFSFDYQEKSIRFINKNKGLSGVGISAIAYDRSSDQLIVAYENGHIDFWAEGSVRNINTIYKTQTVLSKRLRHINIQGNKIYFSGDLGIVVFDKVRGEIIESYQNLGRSGDPLTIYETAFANDSIYAVSASGILSAGLGENINRQDFNNWKRTLTGLSFQHISVFKNRLFASANDSLFRYGSGNWHFEKKIGGTIRGLELAPANNLYVLTENTLWGSSKTGGFTKLYTARRSQSLNSIVFRNGAAWVASSDLGVLHFRTFNAAPEAILPPGPLTDTNIRPVVFNNQIYWLSPSGSISAFDKQTRRWTGFKTRDNQSHPIETLTDIDFGIASNQGIELPVFSSFDRGLFFGGASGPATDINTLFSASSPLPRTVDGSFNITALASDAEQTLWVATTGLAHSLYRWNPVGNSWTTYRLNSPGAKFLKDLFITPEGHKWMSIEAAKGGGIIVFDEKSGKERHLSTEGGQGGLPGHKVTSMAMDRNSFLWVGTNRGIAFFPNPGHVPGNQPLTANVPIFENRVLLKDEFITQIVVDPANRKWCGTRNNGLWLFSETGEALIYHFTTENSPLPSNHITALYLDPPTGEVFISTNKGTVSFRSDATEGTNRHENVQIYPNPVRPSFQREIVISGLAHNALVKITDISGRLVRQVRANGSTAHWNGRNISGKRVSTGVYLVFSASADGSETFVGKIVVI